jgi:hypothetical protein
MSDRLTVVLDAFGLAVGVVHDIERLLGRGGSHVCCLSEGLELFFLSAKEARVSREAGVCLLIRAQCAAHGRPERPFGHADVLDLLGTEERFLVGAASDAFACSKDGKFVISGVVEGLFDRALMRLHLDIRLILR